MHPIEKLQKATGFSQSEIADLIGVSQSSISQSISRNSNGSTLATKAAEKLSIKVSLLLDPKVSVKKVVLAMLLNSLVKLPTKQLIALNDFIKAGLNNKDCK